MKPTRVSTLLAVAVVTGAVVFLVLRSTSDTLPNLPRYAPVSLFIVAIAEALLAHGTRNRLAGRPGTQPIEPLLVARYAALAKASSIVGAIAVGGYAGVIGYVISLTSSPVSRTDTVVAAVGAVAGVALVIAALALERTCRVKMQHEHRSGPGEGPGDDKA